ncbi:hypothetical protein GW915_08870 [bacterium]|nr:hypothetical protein [bacterium]
MDIGGVNKLKPFIPIKDKADIGRSRHGNADRDANGKQSRQERPHIEQLNPEQEEEALKKLNSQPSFIQAGLKAELVREDGKHPHILVKKVGGEILRRLPYQQIINIFINQAEDGNSGMLINRKA